MAAAFVYVVSMLVCGMTAARVFRPQVPLLIPRLGLPGELLSYPRGLGVPLNKFREIFAVPTINAALHPHSCDRLRFRSGEDFRSEFRECHEEADVDFLRQGRGTSYDEFVLAMKPCEELKVVSTLVDFLRQRNLL